jgi:ABC-type sugar transport system permease subunit
MIIATIFEIFFGFVLGYLLKKSSFFIKICRTILIIPMAIAPIVIGLMWRMFLDSNNGLLNYLLHFIGINGPIWLGDFRYALISGMIVDIWQWSSFAMIIYVASMSSISQEIIESAYVDGASRLKVILKVIWPLVAPATILILIFRIIDTFFVFDQIYTLTYGGPGTSTQVVTLYIYNEGLKYFNISKAAAASWIVMIAAVAIAFLLLKMKSKVEKSIY